MAFLKKKGKPLPRFNTKPVQGKLDALIDKMDDNRGYRIEGDNGKPIMNGALLPGSAWKNLRDHLMGKLKTQE